MKVFICILILAVCSAHAGFLQKSRSQKGWSSARQSGWSAQQSGWSAQKSGWSAPQQRGWAPQQRGWSSARQSGWSGLRQQKPQVIKVIHSQAESNPHDDLPTVADLRSSNDGPAKIIRIIHHNDDSSDYGRSAGDQDAKIVKVISEPSANSYSSYSAPEEQEVKIVKIIKQNNGGGWDSSYDNGYDNGRSASSSLVKVIKVVRKPSQYDSQSKW